MQRKTTQVYHIQSFPWKLRSHHGAESLLRTYQSLSYSENFQHFMEPENSLPRSQKPATGPYPQPAESIPRSSSVLP
jgi:hypothetical protein